MRYALTRLLPGLGLIVLAALVLLAADRIRDGSSREGQPGSAVSPSASDKMSPALAPGAPSPQKPWRIHLLTYTDSLNAEETQAGIFAEFKALGLVPGRDYEITRHSAHGDMAVLNSIADAAAGARPDLIITVSTPALQVVIGKVKKTPVVFTSVADGVQAGAGKSLTDHLPNVTGVTIMSDFEGMVRIVREHFPHVRRIGTLFVPGEINSVFYKNELAKAAAGSGLRLEAVGIATAAEAADAALALADRKVDIITQLSDNTTGSAIPAIAEAARKARIPLFGFVTGTVKDGAALVLARDYEEGGRIGARQAVRIMQGEDPAAIPFTPVVKTSVIVSRKNAERYGINIPDALLRRADQVKD